jgi:hypothetical protein
VGEYDDLFDQYVQALREAKAIAERWWVHAMAAQEAEPDTTRWATLSRRWPLGFASHPRVIAVYRHFYMECERLTERRQETDSGADVVEPGSFVTEWLLDDATADLAVMISKLPYAPLGLDEEGNTV